MRRCPGVQTTNLYLGEVAGEEEEVGVDGRDPVILVQQRLRLVRSVRHLHNFQHLSTFPAFPRFPKISNISGVTKVITDFPRFPTFPIFSARPTHLLYDDLDLLLLLQLVEPHRANQHLGSRRGRWRRGEEEEGKRTGRRKREEEEEEWKEKEMEIDLRR